VEEAQLDRVGAFRFEPVAGATANLLPDPVPEAVKEDRYARLMEVTERISAAKLQARIGRVLPVIIDEIGEPDEDGDAGATARSQADAPQIDGQVLLRQVPPSLKPGDFAEALIEDADAHDLFGALVSAEAPRSSVAMQT
jgi:ribosomal protein S12 methylthiotransferase